MARVLIQGLSDANSPLSMLRSPNDVSEHVMEEIVWKQMVNVKEWQFFPKSDKQ